MLKLISNCLLCTYLSLPQVAAVEHEHDTEHADQLIFERGVRAKLKALPKCDLKQSISALPEISQRRALDAIVKIGIRNYDLHSLGVGHEGKLCFSCGAHEEVVYEPASAQALGSPAAINIWDTGFTPSGAVPIASPPILNSKPDSVNIVYIDFNGDTLVGRAWNVSPPAGSPQATINARAYNVDSDNTTFSNSEQMAIYQVWQRVAEDFAPFDINVTTNPFYDDENNRGPKIGHVLVTHSSDFGNDPSGGYAWTDSFADSNSVYYQPALAYYNRMSSGRADRVAECVSHEFGHVLGLGHDGKGADSYYDGHGSGVTSWASIMGSTYNKSMTQWSNGDYYGASNNQDDEAVLLRELGYRADDHGDSIGSASTLSVGNAGTVINNSLPANQGIILSNTDKDVFKFNSGSGSISMRVDPFVVGAHTRGGNLDVTLRLLNNSGAEIATANPDGTTYAVINATVSAGTYYLEVRSTGLGNPLQNPPSGYVSTHSRGQFFISGTVIASATDNNAPLASGVSLLLAGSVNAETIGLTINGNAVAIDAAKKYTASISLPSALTTITLVAIDAAGNETRRTIETSSTATIRHNN